MTQKARSYCQDRDLPLANQLFIQHWGGHYTHANDNLCRYLRKNSLHSHSIYHYFPSLEKNLPVGSVNLIKIRATEGVLEWFRTGSLQSMSRVLGNSVKVVLDHYLPTELLAAWNTRLIRRFQNLWLTVAVAGESFLLEVTDFHNLQDLHAFLKDMLQTHTKGTCPLAEELHRRFAIDEINNPNDSRLHVSISEDALTALYLYQESSKASDVSPQTLQVKDSITGLSPHYFINLAMLIRHAIEGDGSNLHLDDSARQAHHKALERIPILKENTNWADLIVRHGEHNVAA